MSKESRPWMIFFLQIMIKSKVNKNARIWMTFCRIYTTQPTHSLCKRRMWWKIQKQIKSICMTKALVCQLVQKIVGMLLTGPWQPWLGSFRIKLKRHGEKGKNLYFNDVINIVKLYRRVLNSSVVKLNGTKHCRIFAEKVRVRTYIRLYERKVVSHNHKSAREMMNNGFLNRYEAKS